MGNAKPFTYGEHIEKAESIGLVHSTTKRQEKNGTISFKDPIAKCTYCLYASGAIRRIIPGFYSPSVYRLNKTKRNFRGYRDNDPHYLYPIYDTEFIYHPGDYAKLFEILFARVPKYRINKTR